ncbi:hypothetical protein ACFWHQ_03980 [Streptomyces sp. NPDC060334]|uniref:hypothetical protein n=1 Tax=unclassified Streptomyces TaxID=2593676 RepID=UPI00364A46FD
MGEDGEHGFTDIKTSVKHPAPLTVIAAHHQILIRGRTVRTVPESRIVEALLEEALNITDPTDTPDGSP